MKSVKFQERAWKLMKRVPEGKVTTYKIIAERLGTKAYRAVGTACAQNPYSPIVPCHRVVNSDGRIGNYSGKGGKESKVKLLQKEGVDVVDGEVDLKKFLFTF